MHLFLANDSINSFGDVVLLRDPRGRSVYRSLHPVRGPQGAGFAITGSCALHQIFTVTRDEGVAFVEATGDANPIHRQGDVVPGAMTGARAMAGLEALFPSLGITRMNIKFRAIANYGKRTRQQLAISFQGYDIIEARLRVEQEGKDVAEGLIVGKINPEVLRPNVGKWRVNKDELKRVEEFFRALAIAPDLYLRAGGEPNFGYPRAFLASLPSGEMVRKLSGEGGFLTSLDLTFPEGTVPGIVGSGAPEVLLQPAQARPSFSKVLTSIKSGVEEYCKGFALVFRPRGRTAADSALS
jgi:hypothetical protein